jgi:hypothetical protein
MNSWIVLIFSLASDNATLRMRLWRNLKAAGVATLRDGVYLLPYQPACYTVFQTTAQEVQDVGGIAYVLHVEEPCLGTFAPLFDRDRDYQHLLTEIEKCRQTLTTDTVLMCQKHALKFRKAFSTLVDIDFFPGEKRYQTEAALSALDAAIRHVLFPDEPTTIASIVPVYDKADFQGRVWATRQRPWVDRLASAWLISQFIDSNPRFLWLTTIEECPADALGFDFDGATFSHSNGNVTFETLIASFSLTPIQPALSRMAQIVHYLDVGGVQPPEAVGVERILEGLRNTISDDNALLAAASAVFNGLLSALQTEEIQELK